MQVLNECSANGDFSGAAIVATIFLSVFALLIIGDAVLTAYALFTTLSRIKVKPQSTQATTSAMFPSSVKRR